MGLSTITCAGVQVSGQKTARGTRCKAERRGRAARCLSTSDDNAISVLIGVLIILIVGAICFWAIDRFATDGRLANLLKLLVVLVCLGAIVQRLLTLTY